MAATRSITTLCLGTCLAAALLVPIHLVGSRPDPALVSALGSEAARTLASPREAKLVAIYGGGFGVGSKSDGLDGVFVRTPQSKWLRWRELRERAVGAVLLVGQGYESIPATLTFSEVVTLDRDWTRRVTKRLRSAIWREDRASVSMCLIDWEYSHAVLVHGAGETVQILIPRTECGHLMIQTATRTIRRLAAPELCSELWGACQLWAPLPDWVEDGWGGDETTAR